MSEQTSSNRQELTQRRVAFELVYKYTWIYLVCNASALATVVLVAYLGLTPSAFMWVRAIVLVAAAPVLLWMTKRAGEDSDGMIGKLRTVSTVLPIAVIAIDFIPGIAPTWYAVMQSLGAVALIPGAVISRRWLRHLARA